MALNWTMLKPDDRTPVPLPNEMTVTSIDSGVDLMLAIPDEPPTGSSQAGGTGGTRKLKAMGRIWLTDQRLLFTSSTLSSSTSNQSPNSHQLDTLSVPLPSILSTQFVQPTFASNYLTFQIKPSPDGGLVEGTIATVRFKDRAMFEFISLLEKTRERTIYMKRQQMMDDDDEGLPSYTTPAESGNEPLENPPGYDY